MGARLATNRGESNGDGTFFAFGAEDVGKAEVVKGLCGLEDTVGSATLGVDDSLRNPLSIEVGDEVDQVKVLQEKWSILAHSLRFIWMRHRDSIAGGVDSILGG